MCPVTKVSRSRITAAADEIRFTTVACALGQMLLAMRDQAVCALLLGDTAEGLRTELRRRFPTASLRRDDTGLAAWHSRVLARLEDAAKLADLPLDPGGTSFQRRVWQALTEIPAGTTCSYSEIARRIGAPRSARAVAAACAANPIAVLIPCHRVLRQDGSLSGYRWGVVRKRALLAAEANTESGLESAPD